MQGFPVQNDWSVKDSEVLKLGELRKTSTCPGLRPSVASPVCSWILRDPLAPICWHIPSALWRPVSFDQDSTPWAGFLWVVPRTRTSGFDHSPNININHNPTKMHGLAQHKQEMVLEFIEAIKRVSMDHPKPGAPVLGCIYSRNSDNLKVFQSQNNTRFHVRWAVGCPQAGTSPVGMWFQKNKAKHQQGNKRQTLTAKSASPDQLLECDFLTCVKPLKSGKNEHCRIEARLIKSLAF